MRRDRECRHEFRCFCFMSPVEFTMLLVIALVIVFFMNR